MHIAGNQKINQDCQRPHNEAIKTLCSLCLCGESEK